MRKAPSDEQLKKMYLGDKLSSGEIAKKYKMARGNICKHLRRLGITRPESGEESRNRNFNKKQFRSGYPVTFKPNHPRRNNLGYVFDHILQWEKHTGYLPKKGEPVHHIDLDRKNPDIKNLFLFKGHKEHQKAHSSLDAVVGKLIKKGVVKFKDGVYYITRSPST